MKKQRNYSKKLFFAYSTSLIIVLLMLFVSMMIFTYRGQYQKNMETQSQLVSKTAEQLDVSLQGMDRIINGLLFDKDLLSIMVASDAAGHYTNNSRQMSGKFAALDAPLFSTHRIIVFDHELYYTMSKTGENQPYIKEAIATYPWWGKVLEADGEKIVLTPHQDPFDPRRRLVYSVARAITVNGKCFGIAEVQNNDAQLAAFCNLDGQTGRTVVFSQTGELIYPSKTEDEDAFFAALYREIGTDGEDAGSLIMRHNQISYSRSAYSGWITAIYTPASAMVPYALEMAALSVLSFLLLASASLLMIFLITRRLTAPLMDLNRALRQVSLDNLSLVLPDAHGIVEIETINRSFANMFRHLKRTIAQSIQYRANEERANYLALQSQMNPHTLYNTIGMIESVSYMNGDREVSNLCICLSHMLRYISDFTKREYTVLDELHHLNDYATLVMKRYQGKLCVETLCTEDLEREIIPKFTIQPLVENAVKHGFGAGCTMLNIHIEVSQISGGWRVLVQDNGRGFTPQALEELKLQFAHCDACLEDSSDVVNQKIGNLALSNIYIRCRLLHGKRFCMEVGNNAENSGGFVALIFYKRR